MIIKVDENMSLEVYFDPADREQGFDDDIRFRIYESGPEDLRIFAADETSFLLTCEQAERLAAALQKAAADSKGLPHSVSWSSEPRPVKDYRQGLLPLIVSLTLLKHHLNRHPVPDWVHQQGYPHPYQKELMLRNQV